VPELRATPHAQLAGYSRFHYRSRSHRPAAALSPTEIDLVAAYLKICAFPRPLGKVSFAAKTGPPRDRLRPGGGRGARSPQRSRLRGSG